MALAGPRFANDHTETQASGVDIMLVLDLSWSMMALDMGGPQERVSRFDIASQVLEDFVRKRPNDRLGLIVFSAVPYLASPLTLNHAWLIENLRRLHVGLIRDLGTAIGDATAAGAKRLKGLKDSKSRIIILLTDGDNNKGDIDPVPAAQLAAALGVKVYTIGIGIEQPCMLNLFDPATGKLELDANGNLKPGMILQPANYDVLRQDVRSLPRQVLPRHQPPRAAAHLQRDRPLGEDRDQAPSLHHLPAVVSMALAGRLWLVRPGDGPRQYPVQEGAMRANPKPEIRKPNEGKPEGANPKVALRNCCIRFGFRASAAASDFGIRYSDFGSRISA